MDVDSVITQFVDDEGEEVACGESGDVLYTSLFNYAMPLIRYGVGDVGAASDEECSCGRVLPLMKVVEGRRDSVLVLPGGGFLSPVTFLAAMNAFDLYGQIEEFRLVQKKVDLFKIFVRKKDSRVDESVLGSRLATHVAKSLGTDVSGVSVDVEFVDEVPVGSGGKHRSVVSEVRV
jgi:phenylacetate-CoA ligase